MELEVVVLSETHIPDKFTSFINTIKYYIDTNGCWICVSHHKDKDGYPKIRRNGKTMSMGRYVYIMGYGFIPEGMVIRHKCDNPSCINPSHLELGTTADNIKDRDMRGRGPLGVKNGSNKLTEQQVLNIRKDNRYIRDIAKDYGVAYGIIGAIKRKEIWGWL